MFLTDSQVGYVLRMILKFGLISTFKKVYREYVGAIDVGHDPTLIHK